MRLVLVSFYSENQNLLRSHCVNEDSKKGWVLIWFAVLIWYNQLLQIKWRTARDYLTGGSNKRHMNWIPFSIIEVADGRKVFICQRIIKNSVTRDNSFAGSDGIRNLSDGREIKQLCLCHHPSPHAPGAAILFQIIDCDVQYVSHRIFKLSRSSEQLNRRDNCVRARSWFLELQLESNKKSQFAPLSWTLFFYQISRTV